MTATSPDELAAAATIAEHSPTEVQDPRLRHEVRKAAVWIGMLLLAAFVVFFAQPLLVIFAGIVFGSMIDGGARLLGRVLPIRRGWRIAIVMILVAAFLIWVVAFAGTQLARQAAEMPALLDVQYQRLLAWARSHGINVDTGNLDTVLRQLATGVGPVTKAVGGILGGLATLFLIVVLGIYIAIDPRLYERGLAWMVPSDDRDDFHKVTDRMAQQLRRLMGGRLLGMVIEGVGTWIALALYGVPLAALLGLLTGLLAFIPNVGAPVSGLLMVLVGFSGGTEMGLYCLAVYFVVQTVDGNVIMPMVAQKTVDLAPALVLGAQLVFGAMFGILGLALADPILAMLKIVLERRSLNNAKRAAEAEAGAEVKA